MSHIAREGVNQRPRWRWRIGTAYIRPLCASLVPVLRRGKDYCEQR